MVYGAGNHIPWREFAAFIVAEHKALAGGGNQSAAFAANSLSNEK